MIRAGLFCRACPVFATVLPSRSLGRMWSTFPPWQTETLVHYRNSGRQPDNNSEKKVDLIGRSAHSAVLSPHSSRLGADCEPRTRSLVEHPRRPLLAHFLFPNQFALQPHNIAGARQWYTRC